MSSRPFDAELLVKSFSLYRNTIRSAVRGLWSGQMNWYEFWETMDLAIQSQYPQAWRDGASMGGISPADMTDEERTRLAREITQEVSFIARFGDAVERGSKANGGALSPLFARAEMWVNGYNRIVDLAKTYAREDPKLKWQIDAPKESCGSCQKLNGKVKRASYWREKNIYPRAFHCLECKAKCKCSFVETSEPCTPGSLPSLP